MMTLRLLIVLSIIMISCDERPTFHFGTTSDRLTRIIEWKEKLLVTANIGDLYSIDGDSLKEFKDDSIVNINKCKNGYYALRAPNDSTFIVVKPDNSEWLIKNKTGLKSEYFSVWTNEKCEILLEYGMIAFKIQDNSFINMNKVYGFKDITNFKASDRFGYFDNFIFLTKYADYSGGGIFQSYLDSDSNKYRLPNDIKVRDFTIHNDELWLVTGFYESNEGKDIVENKILKIRDGKIEEVVIKGIPHEMDIASIYSNNTSMFLLSEKLGFFELKDNGLNELISIDLRSSKIIPESFIVKDNLIFLATFENGILRFTMKGKDFDIKQIVTSE